MTAHAVQRSQDLLRLALRLDAIVTGVNGLAYLALAKPLNSLFDLPVGLSVSIGAFLLVFAGAVWLIARPATINRTAAQFVVEANILWAMLSVIAVGVGWLSVNGLGTAWAVMQALVVAGFAGLQYVGLRRQPG
jgi:hypothetical protein